MSECRACGQPVHDHAVICASCGDKLAEAIGDIPALGDGLQLADELEVTVTRQSRFNGHNGGRRSATTPLAFEWDVSVQRNALRSTLVGWVRELQHRPPQSLPWPADDITNLARWLLARVDWLRAHPAADEACSEITACVEECRRAIDRPADRAYAGPCTYEDPESGETCGADLYAKPGVAWARCRICGTEYDVQTRQDWMREQLEDRLARPVEISAVMLRLGVPLGYSTIAAYAQHKRIVPRGHDNQNRPLYRIGDVLDIRLGREKPQRVRRHSWGAANLQKG